MKHKGVVVPQMPHGYFENSWEVIDFRPFGLTGANFGSVEIEFCVVFDQRE